MSWHPSSFVSLCPGKQQSVLHVYSLTPLSGEIFFRSFGKLRASAPLKHRTLVSVSASAGGSGTEPLAAYTLGGILLHSAIASSGETPWLSAHAWMNGGVLPAVVVHLPS